MSKLASAKGRCGGGAAHRRHRDAGLLVEAQRVLELAVREVEAEAAAAVGADPARALTGAAADLEHVEVRHLAQDGELVLGVALGAPHEARVAEERAVRGLVLVGVAVPVGAVGAPGLLLGDGTPLDADGLGQVVLHTASVRGDPRGCAGVAPSPRGRPRHVPDAAGRRALGAYVPRRGGRRAGRGARLPARRSAGAQAPEIDAAVLRLVRGLLPVPEVLEVRRAEPDAGQPGLLVTSWLPGERGDLRSSARGSTRTALARGWGGDGTRGRHAGRDADASAPGPVRRRRPARWGSSPDGGLAEWVEPPPRRAGPTPDRARLDGSPTPAQDLLDTRGPGLPRAQRPQPQERPRRPRPLTITAPSLDWEFAHAGHPWTDVGNLLRFERHPAYVDAVLAAWTEPAWRDAGRTCSTARGRPTCGRSSTWPRAPARTRSRPRAELLRAIAESGDLHAWPAGVLSVARACVPGWTPARRTRVGLGVAPVVCPGSIPSEPRLAVSAVSDPSPTTDQ